jgi:hypothetical protein
MAVPSSHDMMRRPSTAAKPIRYSVAPLAEP